MLSQTMDRVRYDRPILDWQAIQDGFPFLRFQPTEEQRYAQGILPGQTRPMIPFAAQWRFVMDKLEAEWIKVKKSE